MSIDFRLHDFLYPRRIWKLRREFEANQWRPRPELLDRQFRRLQVTLRWAFTEVPYYRELSKKLGIQVEDIHDLDTFRRLPVLTKETLRSEGHHLLAARAGRERPLECHTSGTTARPLRFYLDRNAQVLEFAYYWRYWAWGGYRLGSPFAELSSHHFIARDDLCDRVVDLQRPFRRLILNGTRLNREGVLEMGQALRRFRPRFLKGTPSNLHSLALACREAGVDDLAFEAIFSGGEVVTPHLRRQIEATFHAPLLDSYGHMERTVAACQCERRRYHINPDYGLMELDALPSGGPSGPRLAQVIGTSLHNRAMPLIRFAVGDTVELEDPDKTCPCGRTFPLIKGIHGREADVIQAPDGRRISALTLVTKLVSGIDYLQFLQEAPDSIRVMVVPNPAARPDCLEQIQESTRRITGPSMNIHVSRGTPADLQRDPSGKIRPVVGLGSEHP